MLHNIPPCYFQFSFISMITAIKNMKKKKRNETLAKQPNYRNTHIQSSSPFGCGMIWKENYATCWTPNIDTMLRYHITTFFHKGKKAPHEKWKISKWKEKWKFSQTRDESRSESIVIQFVCDVWWKNVFGKCHSIIYEKNQFFRIKIISQIK